MRLDHVPLSRSFRVLWLLVEMGEEPEIVLHSIRDGSLRRPEVLARSPAGRVPALEVDGRVLFESGAICEYLCETRPRHGFGRAPGHPERADYLEWLHFSETVGQIIASLNLQWLFLRDPAARSETVLKIEARRLALALQAVEARLERRRHLLSSGFSAADVMMGWCLRVADRYVRLAPFPALIAYRARLAARPGWQRACALDGPQEFYDREFYEVGHG